MQECFKCHIIKPLEDFYKHPKMTNGRLGKCKECNKIDVQKNYKKRKKQYAIYYAAREKTEKRKAWRTNQQRKQRKKSPIKSYCRQVTSRAVKSGKLIKTCCVVCGMAKVEAHHYDYYDPMNVKWLCRKHHREIHS
jgi:hypothetical protein